MSVLNTDVEEHTYYKPFEVITGIYFLTDLGLIWMSKHHNLPDLLSKMMEMIKQLSSTVVHVYSDCRRNKHYPCGNNVFTLSLL